MLSATDEYAEAKIDFTIDIENKTSRTSPEIQAIYFYSAKDWDIKQNGKKVPYRKSETKPYNYIYSLIVEANKIPKKGWNEITISATRILAQTWSGDTIEDEYTISGNILLEIVTDRGTFSKKIPIQVHLDTLPF